MNIWKQLKLSDLASRIFTMATVALFHLFLVRSFGFDDYADIAVCYAVVGVGYVLADLGLNQHLSRFSFEENEQKFKGLWSLRNALHVFMLGVICLTFPINTMTFGLILVSAIYFDVLADSNYANKVLQHRKRLVIFFNPTRKVLQFVLFLILSIFSIETHFALALSLGVPSIVVIGHDAITLGSRKFRFAASELRNSCIFMFHDLSTYIASIDVVVLATSSNTFQITILSLMRRVSSGLQLPATILVPQIRLLRNTATLTTSDFSKLLSKLTYASLWFCSIATFPCIIYVSISTGESLIVSDIVLIVILVFSNVFQSRIVLINAFHSAMSSFKAGMGAAYFSAISYILFLSLFSTFLDLIDSSGVLALSVLLRVLSEYIILQREEAK